MATETQCGGYQTKVSSLGPGAPPESQLVKLLVTKIVQSLQVPSQIWEQKKVCHQRRSTRQIIPLLHTPQVKPFLPSVPSIY